MLQELGKQNPHIMRLIQEHQADFLRLINEPVEGAEGYGVALLFFHCTIACLGDLMVVTFLLYYVNQRFIGSVRRCNAANSDGYF